MLSSEDVDFWIIPHAIKIPGENQIRTSNGTMRSSSPLHLFQFILHTFSPDNIVVHSRAALRKSSKCSSPTKETQNWTTTHSTLFLCNAAKKWENGHTHTCHNTPHKKPTHRFSFWQPAKVRAHTFYSFSLVKRRHHFEIRVWRHKWAKVENTVRCWAVFVLCPYSTQWNTDFWGQNNSLDSATNMKTISLAIIVIFHLSSLNGKPYFYFLFFKFSLIILTHVPRIHTK